MTCEKIGCDTAENEPSKTIDSYFLIQQILDRTLKTSGPVLPVHLSRFSKGTVHCLSGNLETRADVVAGEYEHAEEFASTHPKSTTSPAINGSVFENSPLRLLNWVVGHGSSIAIKKREKKSSRLTGGSRKSVPSRQCCRVTHWVRAPSR